MSNKEKNALLVKKFEDVFRCSLCKDPVKVVHLKIVVCSNNHTFDFAKQGYVNMLNRPVKSHYDKKLFEARRYVIAEGNLYAKLHDEISTVMKEHFQDNRVIILDAGCGEGSHLKRIVDACEHEEVTGIGLDISKEGIRMAAKDYQEMIWLVGDLANSPLANHSCHAVVNILSPANYADFKRILVPNGLMIKVVPRNHYLQELRATLRDDKDKRTYENDETVSLFKEHFQLVDKINLYYDQELSQIELSHLVEMSPLSWNAQKENINHFIQQNSSNITVDLDILIGINKMKTGNV